MGSGFRKIHQTKDSFLEAREVFVNGFWQLDAKPPNRMSDKGISMIDKYLKGLYVG